MRLLGLDFGDRYIGLAIADATSVAIPYSVLEYEKEFFDELVAILKSESIDTIIIGMPYSLSGSENERTVKTERFIGRLKKYTDLPIEYQDERLSSKAAGRVKAKGRLDALAAADILQRYLDKHATS